MDDEGWTLGNWENVGSKLNEGFSLGSLDKDGGEDFDGSLDGRSDGIIEGSCDFEGLEDGAADLVGTVVGSSEGVWEGGLETEGAALAVGTADGAALADGTADGNSEQLDDLEPLDLLNVASVWIPTEAATCAGHLLL